MGSFRNLFSKMKGAGQRKRPVAILERLKEILDREQIQYRLIDHEEVYTAAEMAASIHAPGRRVAKVLLIWADGDYVLAVVPAHRQLQLEQFGRMIGARQLLLAKEWEMGKLFPDCEVGAMPPFGDLYGLRVFIEDSLAHEPIIYFAAGNHHEAIEMRYSDYARLAHPRVGHFVMEPVSRTARV